MQGQHKREKPKAEEEQWSGRVRREIEKTESEGEGTSQTGRHERTERKKKIRDTKIVFQSNPTTTLNPGRTEGGFILEIVLSSLNTPVNQTESKEREFSGGRNLNTAYFLCF